MSLTSTSTLTLPDGRLVRATEPVVISASRATDIPAFFAEWFANRLQAGYCAWVNPFNAQQRMYVSFACTRVFVFWSKNPKPLLRYLPLLDERGLGYYFQYTLNDYDAEGLEPGVAPLEQRMRTFLELADKLGPQRVVWRFDPLIAGPGLPPEELLARIHRLALRLRGATHKLVFSFADIAAYRKVQNNLKKSGTDYRELTLAEMHTIAQGLQQLQRETGLQVSSCSERIDLQAYGITHNRCVDDALMAELFPHDRALMQALGRGQEDLFGMGGASAPKDPGQRTECGCIVSKDIGSYDTCPHLCTYCYANASPQTVLKKFARRDPLAECMIEYEG